MKPHVPLSVLWLQDAAGQGDYDLCPACRWEDDGGEPWEYSGPNGQTLVEAQHGYLAGMLA